MLIQGDSLTELKRFEDNSIDAMVTDPPGFLLSSGGDGFMGKSWDGINDSWRYLWKNPTFVKFAIDLLCATRVEKEVENGTVEKPQGSAPEFVIIEGEVLVSLLSPLITENQKTELSLSSLPAYFAMPLLSSPQWRETENTALAHATTNIRRLSIKEEVIPLTSTDVQRIKGVTEVMIGKKSVVEFMQETSGLVRSATTGATEMESIRYNVITSSPGNEEELTKNLTLLLCAYFAIARSIKMVPLLITNQLRSIFVEALRVLKPGAHGFVWALPRTSHWTATALEEAGFEIRDKVAHVFSTGFPKSHNVRKGAIKGGIGCACEETTAHLSELRDALQAEEQHGLQQSEELLLQVRGGSESEEPPAERTPEEDCSAGESGLDGSEPGFSQREDVRTRQPRVEGGHHVQAEQGQLRGAEIRAMPRGVSGNGSSRRVCDGTSSGDGETPQAQPDADGGGSSQGPQYEEQPHSQSGTISEQRGTQTCGRCGKPQIPSGIGTALKPAHEEWVLVRKPLEKGLSISENVLKWGTGAINIDASRIGTCDEVFTHAKGSDNDIFKLKGHGSYQTEGQKQGRFPANFMLSHHDACAEVGTRQVKANQPHAKMKGWKADRKNGKLQRDTEFPTEETIPHFKCHPSCPVAELDFQSGTLSSGASHAGDYLSPSTAPCNSFGMGDKVRTNGFAANTGGASRFFYCAKPSKAERNAGCEGIEGSNTHVCIKPTKLMRYLITMICPPGGIVLDPFAGSASTGVAAIETKREFIGIEREEEYVKIGEARIAEARGDNDAQHRLFI